MRAREPQGRKQRVGLLLVPLLALGVLLFGDLDPARPAVTRMAAVALLMAGWWITEAIPIPATALLPVALFPLLGIPPGAKAAAVYFNDTIFLFLGGFLFALTMERWNLHRRIALHILGWVGTGPRRILLGFMLATWFLSMWISNTATTMMMVPMALAILSQLEDTFGADRLGRYSIGLLLGVAYAASIGGLATLIGTPPNLSFVRISKILFPAAPDVSFASWFLFALPLSTVFLVAAWALLGRMFAPSHAGVLAPRSAFRDALARLGPRRWEETVITVLFAALVFLWMFRQRIDVGAFAIPGWTEVLPAPDEVGDGTVAILVALALFLIPAKSSSGRLLDWSTAANVNWGIVLLFGGGFALASGFKESGLSLWIATQLEGLHDVHPVFLVAAVSGTITFLTELTSNTATTEMVLPVLGEFGVAAGTNPLLLMVPATLSASCAFMLPVATPPNAIVFGTGRVPMGAMVRTGLLLNLLGVVLIALVLFLLGTTVLDIEPGVVPEWARAGN